MGLWRNVYKIYFNSHAHVERDAFDIETSSFYDDFNSHAHVERDMIVLIWNAV